MLSADMCIMSPKGLLMSYTLCPVNVSTSTGVCPSIPAGYDCPHTNGMYIAFTRSTDSCLSCITHLIVYLHASHMWIAFRPSIRHAAAQQLCSISLSMHVHEGMLSAHRVPVAHANMGMHEGIP